MTISRQYCLYFFFLHIIPFFFRSHTTRILSLSLRLSGYVLSFSCSRTLESIIHHVWNELSASHARSLSLSLFHVVRRASGLGLELKSIQATWFHTAEIPNWGDIETTKETETEQFQNINNRNEKQKTKNEMKTVNIGIKYNFGRNL